MLYWGGFEGVLFDGRAIRHPASLPGMRERTVTVGAALEQRMIAWRVGWVVAPGALVDDVARVHIYNGLVASGFAQIGVRVALDLGDDHLAAAAAEYQRRRDETLRQLDGPAGRAARPAAGRCCSTWPRSGSTAPRSPSACSSQKVAATPMRGWGGEVADRYVRFVFSNEPVERLAVLGKRVHAALA